MKKATFLFFLMCVSLSFAQAQEQNPLSVLPEIAQQFVMDNFSRYTVEHVVKDFDDSDRFEVIFENGIKIKFNAAGNWTEVDCGRLKVPLSVIPSQINEYVRNYHPKVAVVKIEKDRDNFEVDLSDGMELEFNKDFQLIDD